MYGQTNAWVLPDGKLELLKSMKLMCLFLLTEQLLTLITRTIRGFRRDPLACLSSLIGLPLKSPLSFNEVIYALPMLSIKMAFLVMALHDLKAKPALREMRMNGCFRLRLCLSLRFRGLGISASRRFVCR